MDISWRRSTWHAYCAWHAIEVATGVRCLGGGIPDTSLIPRYRKVAALVSHTSSQVERGSVETLLESIEVFAALSVGQWLKVAGGEKAEVLASAHCGRFVSSAPGVTVELGAFVGYTASRLASHGSFVMTFEQDPIHMAVARWHLNYAQVLASAEVNPGRIVDSLPLLAEAVGAGCVPFAFMDQGGGSFAADLVQLERLSEFTPAGRVTADNCLRPGAYLCVEGCQQLCVLYMLMGAARVLRGAIGH